MEIEPAKRREFLDNAGTTAEIRAEIESLLSFEAVSADFMSLAITDFSKDFPPEIDADEISLVGQEVGIYKIVGELGFGGMGAVYLAERSDGKFSQRVAVKMLKREFNVEKIRRNFKREKEILAKLNHPNIATLLDAGTTADGVPYLVMEYIEGVPIDNFCENNNLSLNLRLKLFNKVCDAVQFAHRNLIIHRDLKPSNILVTEKGEPKLLDFGISQLLGAEDLTDKTAITIFGAMTPEYASPEQIKGETVTTATDIYSLGVVLYKILTNSHPFDLKGKTTGEVLKTISENEPIMPSKSEPLAVAGGLRRRSELVAENSDNKHQPPATVGGSDRSKLKGDIDTIILKSLRKEPERRYDTVEQFAADIWRFIDGLPVLARRATVSYRASKFFRRNKLAAIAGTIVFLSLITGIAVAIWQADVARKQTDFATKMQSQSELETERAKSEEEKAKKISQFMFKVISYANPAWYAEGAKFDGNARVIDVLDDLSDKIDTEFEGQADVQAELHHKFAEVYIIVAQGKNNPVRTENFAQKLNFHALRALELRKQFYGARHELVAKDLFYAYTMIGKNYREQAELLAEAIEMMRETNPKNLNLPYMLGDYTKGLIMPEYAERHEIYRKAARPFTDENKYAIAERYLRESVPIYRFHYKEDNYAIFWNECHLAYALAMQENRKDFDEHFDICKQGAEKLKGGNSAEAMRKNVELVERVVAEKNQPK